MSYFEGKQVLILGGAGLWGSALIRALLALDARIRATEYRRTIDTDYRDHVEVARGDLFEQSERIFDGIDIVFHCAARVGGAKIILSSPSEIIRYNVRLAGEMMYRATKAGVKRFSFVSSSYVYPDTDRPNTEDEGFDGDPPDVHFGIGWSNRYMEKLCQHFHRTTETEFAIARPTAYYGPRDDFEPESAHVIPALIRKAVEKQDPFEVWGDGQDMRNFTYVDDLVEGMLALVEHYAVAEAVNITSSETSTVDDVWKILFKILDINPRVVHNRSKPSVTPYKCSDARLAKELFDFKAKTTLEAGLRKTVDWYLNHRN